MRKTAFATFVAFATMTLVAAFVATPAASQSPAPKTAAQKSAQKGAPKAPAGSRKKAPVEEPVTS